MAVYKGRPSRILTPRLFPSVTFGRLVATILYAMPTVLRVDGYRFYFFSREGQEPPHIHVEQAERYAKFWLNRCAQKLFDSTISSFACGDAWLSQP